MFKSVQYFDDRALHIGVRMRQSQRDLGRNGFHTHHTCCGDRVQRAHKRERGCLGSRKCAAADIDKGRGIEQARLVHHVEGFHAKRQRGRHRRAQTQAQQILISRGLLGRWREGRIHPREPTHPIG